MLDISKISQELGFEREEVMMLLDMFMQSAMQSMQELKIALESADYIGIKEHAHAIKGSAANLMLDEICNLSKEIEEAAIFKTKLDYGDRFTKLYYALKNLQQMETA